MPSCAFIQCTNHSRCKNKCEGVTYHSFPQDALWRHMWLEIVRRQRRELDWIPSQYSRVCSMHFKPEHIFKTSKGLARIIKGALPYFGSEMKVANYTDSRSGSPNSLEAESISDLESILDTPQIAALLKLKVRRLIKEKVQLAKVNKNLKQKNKRLTNKCKSLKETILLLKKVISEGLPEDQFQEMSTKAEAADLDSRITKKKRNNL